MTLKKLFGGGADAVCRDSPARGGAPHLGRCGFARQAGQHRPAAQQDRRRAPRYPAPPGAASSARRRPPPCPAAHLPAAMAVPLASGATASRLEPPAAPLSAGCVPPQLRELPRRPLPQPAMAAGKAAEFYHCCQNSNFTGSYEPISPGARRISLCPQGQNFTSDTQ